MEVFNHVWIYTKIQISFCSQEAKRNLLTESQGFDLSSYLNDKIKDICPSATVIEDLDPEHWKGMEEHKHIFFICRLPPLLTYLSLAVDSFPKNSFIFVGDCSYARPLKGDM